MNKAPVYKIHRGGIVRVEHSNKRRVRVPISNFVAKIVDELVFVDEIPERRLLRIESEFAGVKKTFDLTPGEFSKSAWWLEHISGRANIVPGFINESHLRAAVQALSPSVKPRTIIERIGWTQIDGETVFTHARGILGGQPEQEAKIVSIAEPTCILDLSDVRSRKSRENSVEVSLTGKLALFSLPDPIEGSELAIGIDKALSLVKVAHYPVSVALFGGVWRAVLGSVDFLLVPYGRTGTFKTSYASLFQQFFGAGLTHRNPPATWFSTAASLEALVSKAKSVCLLIDNLIPRADPSAAAKFERIVQLVGDRASRDRLGGDGNLRAARVPDCLVIATAEDIFIGESGMGRIVGLEFKPGWTFLNPDEMTKSQEDGRQGWFAKVMASYIEWLAPRLAIAQANLQEDVRDLSKHFENLEGLHARTSSNLANLLLGFSYFLSFAHDQRALSLEAAKKWYGIAKTFLRDTGLAQSQLLELERPADRFLDLLRSALTSGRAHVADSTGDSWPAAHLWGWRKIRDRDGERVGWKECGERIGWIWGSDLYLDRDSALRVVQGVEVRGSTFRITPTLLAKHLYEAGLLKSHELHNQRQSYLARVTIQGKQRSVLHLDADDVFPKGTESQQNFNDLLDI